MASKLNDQSSSSIYCQSCGAANPVHATDCFVCHEPLSSSVGGTGATTNPLTGLLLPDVIIRQRYRILEVLSTDEKRTVYKAEDTQLGKRVVDLVEIGHNKQSTPENTAKIEGCRHEMLVLAGLVHRNLPRIYDYFIDDHHWYFVMDHLPGGTLEDYIKARKNQPLPVEEVVDIAIQLSTVLEYLHLHQPPLGFNDLSLDTIWRTPDGKLYLLDIGSTRPPGVVPGSHSIASLGRILRQLQTRKIAGTSRPLIALPKLRKQPWQPQTLQLEKFIQQMVDKNAGKRPYAMGIVKQEMQLLATQCAPRQKPSTKRRSRLSRRTLLRMSGLTGLAVATGTLTALAEIQVLGIPHPGYSTGRGGTICTYYTGSGVLGVTWSPDGRRIVMGNVKGKVQALDANTGLSVINFQAPSLTQRVEDVIWLPDGKTVAAGGDDNLVWVWDATTGKLRITYRGHTNWVISLASSPDSRYIASGGYDTTVQVWKATTGRPNVTYTGHTGYVTSVTWSPDGRYIASGSNDGTIQVWEALTGRPAFTYKGHGVAVYTVAWSPDGQRIASGDVNGIVYVWPVTLFESSVQQQYSTVTYVQQKNANNSPNNAVQAVAWSPDSRYIASVAHDVQIWNSVTGKHIFTYANHASSSFSLAETCAWSPNGRYIASGGFEGTVQVWDAE